MSNPVIVEVLSTASDGAIRLYVQESSRTAVPGDNAMVKLSPELARKIARDLLALAGSGDAGHEVRK